MKRPGASATLLALAMLACVPASSAERPLYIDFDGSNSMWGELDGQTRKIDAADKVFGELDAGILHDRELALRLYAHRRARDCSDTERINRVSPRGKRVRCDSSALLLAAGRYSVQAWSRLGTFNLTAFEVAFGDTPHVPIQQIAE